MEDKPYTFALFGRSGAGKGEQSDKLVEYLNKSYSGTDTLHIVTGKLFREFTKNNTSHSRDLVDDVLNEGGLLPAFLPIWMWSNFLVNNYTGKENIVFDGVARRIEEAPILEEALRFYKRQTPFVVYIDVPREVCKQRLLDRGRFDDTEEDIEERLRWYEDNVVPVIEFFKKSDHVTFVSVDGEQDIEAVHTEILKKTVLSLE